MPHFVALQSEEPSKINACLLIAETLSPEKLLTERNIVAARIPLRNNCSLTVISLYVSSPADDECKQAKELCLDLVEDTLHRGEDVWIGGDFNCLRSSKFMAQLEAMLPHVLEGTGKELRARGRARVIDFVLCSLPLAKEPHSSILAELSDHDPILSSLQVHSQKLNKSQPDSSITSRVINEALSREEPLPPVEVWTTILRSGKFKANPLFGQNAPQLPEEQDYQEYLRNYLESYEAAVGDLATTRFTRDTRQWFEQLQRLTKYSEYAKRDGSIAKRCISGDRLLIGESFRRAAVEWYSSLSSTTPKLTPQSKFPEGLQFDEALLNQPWKFQKAISIDCLDSTLFVEGRGDSPGKKERRRALLRSIFSPEFWEMPESRRCLMGRLVLLNKDHPSTPQFGRFRPIRICSNIVKLLELHLAPKLHEWGQKNLAEQFGFISGVGCEAARTLAFRKMVQLRNSGTPFYVLQVDLRSAYNAVNLFILHKMVQKVGFWDRKEIQLWRFLATNSKTWLEGAEVQDINGLPQGSLLSPMLFNLYINTVLVQARALKNSLTVGYADDLIVATTDIWELERFCELLRRFCEEQKMIVNFDKSDIIVSGVPRPGKMLFGFPIRKKAKYLGVTYDGSLSVEKSLAAFVPKERYIFFRLYRVLRRADFRTRYNLWQVFICPLIRMVVSLVGEPNSHRGMESFREIRKAARRSLKQFTLCPRGSDTEFFDELSRTSDQELNFILSRSNATALRRIQELPHSHLREDNEWEFLRAARERPEEGLQIRKWRAFHPRTEEILRTINLRECAEHPGTALTVRHLEEAHPRAGGWRISSLLISERKGNAEWDNDAVNLILRLTGRNRFPRIP